MKITGIEIGEYRQFKNIKFDFTYPADHAKAGQPLEKVCFIGQSGTGKTTLLNIIQRYFTALEEVFDSLRENRTKEELENDFLFNDFDYDVTVRTSTKDGEFTLNGKENGERSNIIEWFTAHQLFDEINQQKKICIYIEDSVAAESSKILRRTKPSKKGDSIKILSEINEDRKIENSQLESFDDKKILRIGPNSDSNTLWKYLLVDINKYDENINQVALSMIQQIESFSADRLIKRVTDWKANNHNPRLELATKCLNPLLKPLFLELDIENTEAPIVLKTISGVTIRPGILSTGTKQLLTTAIPIFQSRNLSTVILLDEPERSLFPDIQRDLINYYTSLAPEAQFFFATHSPIIASAFEPCERFILYFDQQGEVKFHNGVAPEGDDPNDILRQDFDMAELMLQKGLEAYDEYRRLAMAIRAETEEEKKNELIAKRLELGNRYNF